MKTKLTILFVFCALLVASVASAQSLGDILRCVVLDAHEGVTILECTSEAPPMPTITSGVRTPVPTLVPPTATHAHVPTVQATTTLTGTRQAPLPATRTPVPAATATAVLPTVTPTPGEPTAAIAPFVDAPACETHDATKWHGLWNDVDGCHYDHTHYVNPLAPAVVALFGDYTAWTGQEVSYPWQTFAGAAPGYPTPPVDVHYENDFKHNGYKFDFYDFPISEYGCTAANPTAKFVPNAWLIERHSLGHKPDYMSRVHSVFAMVRFCIPDAPGEEAWLITGGWQDFGQRIAPYQGNIYPIPGSPEVLYPSPRAPYIAHNCKNHDDCRSTPKSSNTAWISFMQMIDGHRLFGFGFRSHDSQAYIDASEGFNTPDPTFRYWCADAEGNYVAEGCMFNHSTSHTYQVTGSIPDEYDLWDGVEDGRVNYEGWTDRWGNIVTGCIEAALDCVPVKMVNLPVGFYHANVAQYGLDQVHQALPEFSLCTLDGVFVDCTTEGAIDVGWISSEN